MAANKNQGPQGEAPSAALNVTDSARRDSTDGLQRKLDAIRKRNITVQSTSVTQQQSFKNSAHSAGTQGQHNDVQLSPERIQQRQEEVSLPSSECEPPPEGDMMDKDGSELGKGRLVEIQKGVEKRSKELLRKKQRKTEHTLENIVTHGLAKPSPKRDPSLARGKLKHKMAATFSTPKAKRVLPPFNMTKAKPPQAYIMSRLGLAKPSPKRDHP
ncbi:hypothetical protein PIB30_105950 [Stylosanthes scabra]|uniref:Uncharacterized protein n=1 Tax=Stylosanthes scabra TaxID=79078 RepID=A0ABU6SZ65_9FABA|nr:hypothetical protein [Stylosanthes scabra]